MAGMILYNVKCIHKAHTYIIRCYLELTMLAQ
jgi:hypothetical protein